MAKPDLALYDLLHVLLVVLDSRNINFRLTNTERGQGLDSGVVFQETSLLFFGSPTQPNVSSDQP
jgi:hypothetical protein